MKKFFSIVLTIILVFTALPSAFALEVSKTTLNFNLTSEGKNEITVPTGTEIIVTFTLENKTDASNYIIGSFTNEITYDNKAFQFVEFVEEDLLADTNTSTPSYSSGNMRVYFNGYAEPKGFDNIQKVGSFKLKVLADKGRYVIATYPKKATAFFGISYAYAMTDLIVNIGDVKPEDPEKFTLTFNTNGGEDIDKVTKEAGTKIDLSDYVPVKSRYTFSGWYSDSKLENEITEITLTKNTTIYAKWEKKTSGDDDDGGGTSTGGGTTTGGGTATKEKFTLTFNANGGSDIDKIAKESGSKISLSSYVPEKSGYTFEGWYSESSLENKITEITLTKNTTIYAKWDKKSTGTTSTGSGSITKYKLSFETNGGSSVTATSKVRNTTVDLSKYITTKDGYSFDGWHTDKELKNKVTSVKMSSNVTLYAKWVKGDNGYQATPNYKPDIFTQEHTAYIVGREGGYIAPMDNLTRAEAATMFFRLVDAQVLIEGLTKENSFSDVNEGDWFNTAVSTLAKLEVLNGRTADTFVPYATITRAEFMTIVSRLSEAQYDGEDLFVDITNHWAKDYINVAASINWANGDGGLFRPDDNVTRAEAMTIINRALNRRPQSADDLTDGMIVFKDNDVNAWYYVNVQEATNSHDFEIKADGIHEKWTALKENPSWAEIEK